MSAKTELRRELQARRRGRDEGDRWRDAAELAAALPAVLGRLVGAGDERPVCLYVPMRFEPGAAPDGAVPLLDAAVALGVRILLPVTVGPAPLDWAPYSGRADLVAGSYGLLEPTRPRHGAAAIAGAAAVIVPALAASPAGVRLGRGAGFYDRSLPLADPSTPVVALVGDDELLDELPAEPHDVRVGHVWRPSSGLLPVG